MYWVAIAAVATFGSAIFLNHWGVFLFLLLYALFWQQAQQAPEDYVWPGEWPEGEPPTGEWLSLHID